LFPNIFNENEREGKNKEKKGEKERNKEKKKSSGGNWQGNNAIMDGRSLTHTKEVVKYLRLPRPLTPGLLFYIYVYFFFFFFFFCFQQMKSSI